ncbi:hypothetical protein C5137_27105 [Bacillus cereus]|nr:hypothetical protein [Bacillus cereus]
MYHNVQYINDFSNISITNQIISIYRQITTIRKGCSR